MKSTFWFKEKSAGPLASELRPESAPPGRPAFAVAISAILAGLLFFAQKSAFARPEYALQIQTNRCTTCHTSPAGGGHRNLTGKAFGPKAAPLQPFSEQDVFGFDFRTVLYTPVQKEDREKKRSGLGVMTALPSVSVPFHKSGGREWRLLYSHNIGGFLVHGANRDAFLRVKLYDDYRLYPQYVTAGRFNAPFGLLDDEHRTYIRQQTKTTWNQRDIGLLLSGDWTHRLHYDLALVNGEKTEGATIAPKQILQWGTVANLRYLSGFGLMAGVSASYYHGTDKENRTHAFSLYKNLLLDNLTKGFLPGDISAEAVLARNGKKHAMEKNPLIYGSTGDFVSNTEYINKIKEGNSDSLGGKVQWNYRFLPAWRFILKYDYLALDREFLADGYQRIGGGFRYFFTNQTSAQIRYEKAIVGHKSETELPADSPKGFGAVDAIWALLQVKI